MSVLHELLSCEVLPLYSLYNNCTKKRQRKDKEKSKSIIIATLDSELFWIQPAAKLTLAVGITKSPKYITVFNDTRSYR